MSAPSLQDRLSRMVPTLSVGMLTADMMSLGSQVRLLEPAGVKLLHFDIMDGCFCPMMTLGPPTIKGIKTPLLKDVHLMIQDPLEKLEWFVSAGADMVTVPVEGCRHPHRALQALGKMTNVNEAGRGILRGISLNPGTPLTVVEPLIEELDVVLLLAINPGWGGQKFIGSTARRIKTLREMIRASGRPILVEVDGGVTRDNVAEVARMGADIIVTGSAVFDGKDAEKNAREMLGMVAAERKG